MGTKKKIVIIGICFVLTISFFIFLIRLQEYSTTPCWMLKGGLSSNSSELWDRLLECDIIWEEEDKTCERISMCMNNDCQYGSKQNKRCIYSYKN